MKSKERQQLKENEIALAAIKVKEVVEANRSQALTIALGVLLLAAVTTGFLAWRRHAADAAGAALGRAMAVQSAQIAPPSTLPGATQVAGTYPTQKARDEAALAAFQDVAAKYSGTDAGQAANYQVGAELLALGRWSEAEQAFKTMAGGASSSLYAQMARMGLGQAQAAAGKYDDAIKTFTDVAADRDAIVPVDGVLAQLGRVQMKAGKTQDAKATLKRVVDDFPESTYVAEVKQQLASLN